MSDRPVVGSTFDTTEWWEQNSMLHGLHTLLDPIRVPYFVDAINARFSEDTNVRLLDIGCGGGFLTEGLVKRRAQTSAVGLDLSHAAITAARAHATATRLPIDYLAGDGSEVPFPGDSFDVVVCSEVLEHVDDPAAVVRDVGRVLAPGGLFLFSSPNRTWLSHLVLIRAAQDWRVTRVLPANLHSWERFIRPAKLALLASRAGLEFEDVKGVVLRVRDAPGAISALARLKRGSSTYAEAGQAMTFSIGRSKAVAYIGTARKAL